MKNYLLLLIVALLSPAFLSAQSYSHQKPNRIFGKKQTDLQFGYGLIALSKVLDGAETILPPLTVQADRFLSDNFSLGVSYTQSSHQSKPIIVRDGFAQRVTNNTHQAGVRAAFHVTKLDNADFYGGFKLAVNFQEFSVDQGNFDFLSTHLGIVPSSNKVSYSGFIGGRYAFAKKWNAFGEIGFSQALVMVGIGYRI